MHFHKVSTSILKIRVEFVKNGNCGMEYSDQIKKLIWKIEQSSNKTYKDAFALFDKKGTGQVPVQALGDLLRAVGQNPTLAEIDELEKTVDGDRK